MGAADHADRVEVRSRAELRAWLAAHHRQGDAVWLVSYKKRHPDYLDHAQIVEELLCWGWIDSLPRKLDAERAMLLIAPRNPRSAWSAVNKAHVARARADGAMTAAGEAAVAAAEANGMWNFLDDVERLEVPADLAAALGPAAAVWEGWPRSVRRGTLEWIKTARTAATRARRIAQTAESAAQGLRPPPFRRG